MKKSIAILLSAVLAIGCLAGCGSKNEKKSETQAATEAATGVATEKTTFTVGFDQDFPPYGFVGDNGEFTGFDIELATEVAKRLNLEIKLQPIDWDAKDMELSSGAIDCIWNGFTMNGREDAYEWTDAYVNNTQVFVLKDDAIKSAADLKGKVVTVQTDSSAQAALDEEKFADLKASFKELVVCANYNTAFMDLESGAVDAIAMDVGVAKYQIESRKVDFKVLDDTLAEEQYGVGFLKGNTELRDKVQKALEDMVKDGTFAEISTKWFGEDVGIIGK